ncbi:hypothetical protein Y032_1083g3575 [Ancylostoma ceylanicum]|uniref:Acyl-CoA dehydrogenase/oxidase N-terminal domain-containing protein n=1 Tax=Ancylostoma ceylanicum TaxID=53326 RepID=A0A016W6S8_9BILA|nr:hypothetical protein Y032_1083g3575 [Ancylostoma ceylanicum]
MLSRSALRLATVSRSSLASNRSMSFDLTDTQKEIQATALKFAKEEMIPQASKYDESGEFPWDLVRKAHSLGLMNPQIPEKYGGPGMSTLDTTLIVEALAYGCTGIQLAIMGPSLAVAPVYIAGNEEQKKKYLGNIGVF